MNDTPKDPTTAFAEEIAKQLPVKAIYRDAVKPAAKQTGQLAQDIVKTIQLALAPLQFLGAYQDRLRSFIDRSVRAVPEDQRVSPPPQILGPIVEGIRYEPEGTALDEMFSKLLSSSMDSARLDQAHPAYPAILRQLSADEARILAVLRNQTFDYVWTKPFDRSTNLFGVATVEIDAFPKNDLIVSDKLPFYMDHLHQLGLAGIFQDGNQEPQLDAGNQQIGVRCRSKYQLTAFGQAFIRACT